MSQQWRVGSGGLRVFQQNGSVYSLPPGAVLDELPERYEGTLDVVERKQVHGYQDKAIRPGFDTEDKAI